MSEKKFINEKFPHFLHGGDYNPEQWIDTKEIWDEDMRLMQEANCNEMSVGIFSWAMLEPKDGEYDFSFMDEILDKIYANGGRVFLATPSGARPHWLGDKYPEVYRVDNFGRRMHFGGRHNHCLTSPEYRRKVREINTRLAQRYSSHPAVIGWHISNEYNGECFCPLCQQAFREYLKKRYDGDINKLNFAYWTTFWSHKYDNFDQIEAPGPMTETSVHGLNIDWRRFISHQTVDFMKEEIKPLKAVDASIPVTTNMMPGVHTTDYSKFAEHLDVVSWDSYPDWHVNPAAQQETAFWHDYFRTLKGRPFMLMESAPGLVNWKPYNKLKRPGVDVLASMQAIAHGSDTVQYFQFRKSRGSAEKFHGAVVDHVGTNQTRVFKEVQKTGARLKALDGDVAGTIVKSDVAIMYDLENRWALDNSQGFQNRDKKYIATAEAYHKSLWKRAISVDVITPKDGLDQYKLVILPMQYMVTGEMLEKIRAYVEGGGTVYATYTLGMVDGTDLCYLGGFPGGVLKDVFGIWNEEIDTLTPEDRGEMTFDGKKYEIVDYSELVHLRGAKALGEYTKEFYAGMPAFTVNEYGKGKAYYQTFRDTGAFKDAALDMILKELDIKGVIPTPPANVTAHARTDGEHEFLFVENYNAEPVDGVKIFGQYEEIETGEKVNGEISLPAYSVRVFKK